MLDSRARELSSLKDRERRLVETSTGWRQELTNCEAASVDLEAQLEQITKENAEMAERLSSMQAERSQVAAAANEEVAALGAHRNTLVCELEATNTALIEARKELTARVKGNQSLEQQVRKLQNELKVVRSERDQAFEGHEQLSATSEATFLELKHRSELCAELTQHRKSDAQTLAQAREEVQYLNDVIAQLSGHNNAKQKIQRVQKIEADNMSLRKQNLELRNQLRSYTLGLPPSDTVEEAAAEVLHQAKQAPEGISEMAAEHCRTMSTIRGVSQPKQLTQPKTPKLHTARPRPKKI